VLLVAVYTEALAMRGPEIGIVVLLCLTALLWVGAAEAAPTDAEKCAAGKQKEVGKYLACRQKAQAKATLRDEPADYSKCDEKLIAKVGKLDDKYGAECPTTGDEESLLAAGEFFTDEVMLLLGGADPCPGDGVLLGSNCWYLGAIGISCNQTCAQEGRVYSLWTTLLGSEAEITWACDWALSALKVPFGRASLSNRGGVGCSYSPDQDLRIADPDPTTAEATYYNVRRVCACDVP
jgi:hypothetical protein